MSSVSLLKSCDIDVVLLQGALDALEQEIMEFFKENPGDDFVADHLDSYERLLAHAASKYHQLQSRSKN